MYLLNKGEVEFTCLSSSRRLLVSFDELDTNEFCLYF